MPLQHDFFRHLGIGEEDALLRSADASVSTLASLTQRRILRHISGDEKPTRVHLSKKGRGVERAGGSQAS